MLRTNSSEFIKALDQYLIDSMETETAQQAADAIVDNFVKCQLSFTNYYTISKNMFNLFLHHAQGLGCNGLFDYWYNVNAIQLLGDMLQETETERNKYTEQQAAEKLTAIIYDRVNKLTKQRAKDEFVKCYERTTGRSFYLYGCKVSTTY